MSRDFRPLIPYVNLNAAHESSWIFIFFASCYQGSVIDFLENNFRDFPVGNCHDVIVYSIIPKDMGFSPFFQKAPHILGDRLPQKKQKDFFFRNSLVFFCLDTLRCLSSKDSPFVVLL